MNGMHRTQFDHARLDLLSPDHARVLAICPAYNLHEAQRWSESVLAFDRCRPHSITFGYL